LLLSKNQREVALLPFGSSAAIKINDTLMQFFHADNLDLNEFASDV